MLIVAAGYMGAQQDLYKQVAMQLKKNSPSLILENKVLVINFINTDITNKTIATDLEKTANVYEYAKLKGGRKGVVCVSIVPSALVEITLNKEGYKKTIKLLKSEIGNTDVAGIENIVFNSAGEVVYKNIEASKIYESVQNLITR